MDNSLILVVDDHEDARHVHSLMLEQWGFRAAEAHNGHEAIERALQLSPAVILLDLFMPHMGGLEAARRFKADERTRGIPLIALTAAGDEDEAARAGIDFFLRKPVNAEQLLIKIQRAIQKA